MKIILLGLLAAAVLYLYFQKNDTEKELTRAENRIATLESHLNHKQAITDSLESMILPPDTLEMALPTDAASTNELGSLNQTDIRKLQRKGLKNPEAELKNDLSQNQSRLIPVKGTMGGTMAVRKSRILNGKYVLAYYEDGHNGGNLLLKYEVNNGSITWTVIDHSKL